MSDAKPFSGEAKNTDKELWRRKPGDFYSPSIHVTIQDKIGIDVGGHVYVQSVKDWHESIATIAANHKRIEELIGGEPMKGHDNCSDCGRAMVWSHDCGTWMCPRCVYFRMTNAEQQVSTEDKLIAALQSRLERMEGALKEGVELLERHDRGQSITDHYKGCGLQIETDAYIARQALKEESDEK